MQSLKKNPSVGFFETRPGELVMAVDLA